MFNNLSKRYFIFCISFLAYLLIGYGIQRSETLPLLLLYCILFALYCLTILKKEEATLKFWIYSGILFRLMLLFSIPNLSDDFYRFIWDGRLLCAGHHPFAQLPSFYIENHSSITGIDESLFTKLNSKNYFTIYPPIAQFIFWLSATLASSVYGSLVILKMTILLAEMGSILIIKKLLQQLNIEARHVLLYALNPLVILELTGNIHLEGLMIFFLLLACYLIIKNRIVLGAVAFSIAISIKLIPIIFLPALLLALGWKKAVSFYMITTICCIIFLIPLLSPEIITGFQNSIGYYFSKFEFNASLYYIIRALGFAFWGFNIIHAAGWALGFVATILILLVSFSKRSEVIFGGRIVASDFSFKRLFDVMLWCLVIYFLFTTTLHPWYITTLLAISIFTNYRFVVLWSGLIFFTYTGYSATGYSENMWIVFLEYAIVFGYLLYELKWNRALLTT